jgi:type I restriction enzyme S subunit
MSNPQFALIEIGSVLEKVANAVAVQPDATYREIGIRSHGKGLFDKEPVSGASLGDKRVFWVEPDCFIVNIVFAWEMAVGRTSAKDIGKIASHRFPMYRPRNGRADIDFITYYFKTEHGRELLALASPGGAGRNKTLGQSEFLKLKVRIPSAPEQRRIAEVLLTWDRAIETLQNLVANARAQKTALIQTLLTGKRRLIGFSGAWVPAYLSERGAFRKGKGISRADVKTAGLPCVRYGELYTRHHDVVRNIGSFIDEASASLSQPIQTGDILFACSGETVEDIGKCAAYIGDEQAFAGGDIVVFSPKQDSAVFLAYLLNSPSVVMQKSQMGQGHSVVHIGMGALGKLQFEAPTRPEQDAIADCLLRADAQIRILETQLNGLVGEKAALMQQLLTGKRRVNVPAVAA